MAPALRRLAPPDLALGRDGREGLVARLVERWEGGRDALGGEVRPLLAVRPGRLLSGRLLTFRRAGSSARFRTGRPSDSPRELGRDVFPELGVPARLVGTPARPPGCDLVRPEVRGLGESTLPRGVRPAVRERSATCGEDPVLRDPTLPEGRVWGRALPVDVPPAVATGVTVLRRGLTAGEGVADGDLRPR